MFEFKMYHSDLYDFRVDEHSTLHKRFPYGKAYGPISNQRNGRKTFANTSTVRAFLDPRSPPRWFFLQNFSFGLHYDLVENHEDTDLSTVIIIENWQ